MSAMIFIVAPQRAQSIPGHPQPAVRAGQGIHRLRAERGRRRGDPGERRDRGTLVEGDDMGRVGNAGPLPGSGGRMPLDMAEGSFTIPHETPPTSVLFFGPSATDAWPGLEPFSILRPADGSERYPPR